MEEFIEKSRFVGTAKGTSCVGHICDECIRNGGKFSVFGVNPTICCFDKTEKCLDGNPDYVFIQREQEKVMIFSKYRVPFDKPKNKQGIESLKKDIIKTIKTLQFKDTTMLQARYGTTEKKGFYDIENVLFYNIGTKTFNALAKNGVVFSSVNGKEIEKLHKKYGVPSEYTHYYEYSLFENLGTKAFLNPLAEWKNVPLTCVALKPAKVWKTMQEEKSKISILEAIDTDSGDTFAIMLEIEKQSNQKCNIMTAMKPLLDGLICTFHSSEFTKEELQDFLTLVGGKKEFFTDKSISVLGERKDKFVQKYRNSVKWNPADHLCNYVAIRIKESTQWNVSGKIYASIQCPHCGTNNMAKLLWGMPAMTDELQKDIAVGRIKLAGCCIEETKPRYYCNVCKKRFNY